MRWSGPETMNAVKEISKFMSRATERHVSAMIRILRYCVSTEKRGFMLKPNAQWDGSPIFEFTITGKSSLEFGKDESRRSENGWSTFMNDASISYKSRMMPIVAILVTEAELFAATLCAQDMMFETRVLNLMGLKVELPMTLFVDNKGASDLCNNWSIGGRTRHIEIKQYFLRDLKEEGYINVKWKKGKDMTSNIFTKNLARGPFEKHTKLFIEWDDYMKNANNEIASEGK